MDSFIKIVDQKKDPIVTTIHTKHIDLIRKYIHEGKNVFICGSSGVGKSYILKAVLHGLNHVELQPEHLKSKSLFLPFIRPSTKHVFIEDYDPIFKPIVEKVADGDRISRGCLLVTTTSMCMYPNFETVFIPKHKPEVLKTLTDKVGIDVDNAAIRAQGNIRNFFTYLDGYDEIDDFGSPKDFINGILSDPSPIEIYDRLSEHGHIWDIFQENYLNSEGVDFIKASHSFSEADMYDTYMYSQGEWNLMPYFVLHALTIPKTTLGQPIAKDTIRAGSCWTKFGNYKMRKHKFDEISKKSRMGLGIEELCVLKKYAESGNLEPLVEYKITPQDFDVINHLAVGNGLKSRDVTRVKKALKNVYER
jgi:energy-coupling factor transporter ATP-binding protein EcfA2